MKTKSSWEWMGYELMLKLSSVLHLTNNKINIAINHSEVHVSYELSLEHVFISISFCRQCPVSVQTMI